MTERVALRWLTVPDGLAAVAVAAATAWGVVSVADDGSFADLLPAVVTVLLVAGAFVVRRRVGFDRATAVLPAWFVPVVVIAAPAIAATRGAGPGVAALVMSSPAAAMLAVPAAFAVGAARARGAGVRMGGIDALRAATQVDTVVLNKSGTVTTGDLTVVSVDPYDADHDRNLRWFAGALEKASGHPVGRAIATLSARGRLTDVEEHPGQGIRGSVDRHPVRVGSPEWMGFEPAPTMWTTVGVEVDGRALGTITVADDVRPDVARHIARLSGLGLRLVLVSDDTHPRTQHVAELAGIGTFHAPFAADAISDHVQSLEDDGRRVAVVGFADAPASTLAIASAAAADGPTIIVDDCSPQRVTDALTIARATSTRVVRARQATVALGLLGAAAGALSVGPIVAGIVAVAIVGVTAVVAVTA